MKVGDKTKDSIWCNDCRSRDIMEIILITKNKRGRYYPYRDTMEAETYHYTELKAKCLHCGAETKAEDDQNYTMGKSDMEKYGYRGANYGS